MKRLIVLLLFTLIMSGCAQTNSVTQNETVETNFPEKPIQMILPFAPGSSYDVLARAIAQVAPKYLPNKGTIVVTNKPGGNNTMGVVEVFQAKPDGYTLGFIPSSTITTQIHYNNTPYQVDSFQPIIRTTKVSGMVYIKGDAPWKSFEEWLAYVKQNPNTFSISTVQGGKAVLSRLNKEAGIEMKIVPYDGSAPAMTAFLGGHVDAVLGVPAEGKDLLDSGEIRVLFSTAGTKSEGNVTLKELGYDIEENKMTGIIAPKGLPKEELAILHDAFKKALEDKEVVELIEKMGLQPYYGNPEQFQKSLDENFVIDKQTLQAAGLIQ